MLGSGGRLIGLVALGLVLTACGRPADRPARGAAPGGGSDAATEAVPPTLVVTDDRLRALAARSPEPAASPSPLAPVVAASPLPAPSTVSAQPPIVRTINPSADAAVPAGGPVTVSAVLIGRGADLAEASLTVDGSAVGTIDRQSPRQWTIRGAPPLAPGRHTVRVVVNDAGGGRGGFTWQFSVGQEGAGAAAARPSPSP